MSHLAIAPVQAPPAEGGGPYRRCKALYLNEILKCDHKVAKFMLEAAAADSYTAAAIEPIAAPLDAAFLFFDAAGQSLDGAGVPNMLASIGLANMNSKGKPREKFIDGKHLRCFYRRNQAEKITQKVYNFEGEHFWFLALVADKPLMDLPMHAVNKRKALHPNALGAMAEEVVTKTALTAFNGEGNAQAFLHGQSNEFVPLSTTTELRREKNGPTNADAAGTVAALFAAVSEDSTLGEYVQAIHFGCSMGVRPDAAPAEGDKPPSNEKDMLIVCFFEEMMDLMVLLGACPGYWREMGVDQLVTVLSYDQTYLKGIYATPGTMRNRLFKTCPLFHPFIIGTQRRFTQSHLMSFQIMQAKCPGVARLLAIALDLEKAERNGFISAASMATVLFDPEHVKGAFKDKCEDSKGFGLSKVEANLLWTHLSSAFTGDDSTYYAMRPQLFEMLAASHQALPAYVDGLLTHEVVHGSSAATRAAFGLEPQDAQTQDSETSNFGLRHSKEQGYRGPESQIHKVVKGWCTNVGLAEVRLMLFSHVEGRGPYHLIDEVAKERQVNAAAFHSTDPAGRVNLLHKHTGFRKWLIKRALFQDPGLMDAALAPTPVLALNAQPLPLVLHHVLASYSAGPGFPGICSIHELEHSVVNGNLIDVLGLISHLTAPIQGVVAVVAGLPNSGTRLEKAVNMSEHGCVDCTICLHLHCFCVKSFAYLIYKLKQLHTQAVRPTAQQLLSAVHSFVQGWRRKNKTNIDHVLTKSGFLNLDAGTKGQKKVNRTSSLGRRANSMRARVATSNKMAVTCFTADALEPNLFAIERNSFFTLCTHSSAHKALCECVSCGSALQLGDLAVHEVHSKEIELLGSGQYWDDRQRAVVAWCEHCCQQLIKRVPRFLTHRATNCEQDRSERQLVGLKEECKELSLVTTGFTKKEQYLQKLIEYDHANKVLDPFPTLAAGATALAAGPAAIAAIAAGPTALAPTTSPEATIASAIVATAAAITVAADASTNKHEQHQRTPSSGNDCKRRK